MDNENMAENMPGMYMYYGYRRMQRPEQDAAAGKRSQRGRADLPDSNHHKAGIV